MTLPSDEFALERCVRSGVTTKTSGESGILPLNSVPLGKTRAACFYQHFLGQQISITPDPNYIYLFQPGVSSKFVDRIFVTLEAVGLQRGNRYIAYTFTGLSNLPHPKSATAFNCSGPCNAPTIFPPKKSSVLQN